MDPVWTDPITIGFGLASAAVFVIAALFSTRANRNVAAFMMFMWAATKAWNYKTGTDAQIYMDSALALFCGLLCVLVMHRDRQSKWPLIVLAIMVLWEFANASYSEPGRDYGPKVKVAYQLASNVLYGLALLVVASPGVSRGALVIRRMFGVHPVRRNRPSMGAGWGREAPNAVSKRAYPGRR